jgi:NHLM bacteriocin system ABC transporter ATP-binding protein
VERIRLTGRTTLTLGTPSLVRVEEGMLSLHVTMHRGDGRSVRQFLWAARSGDTMFPCAGTRDDSGYLSITAEQDSTVLVLPGNTLSVDEAAAWLNRIAVTLQLSAGPSVQHVTATDTQNVLAGQNLRGPRTGAVLLSVREGSLAFGGFPDVSLDPSSAAVLMPAELYATATASSTIAVQPAQALSCSELLDAFIRTEHLLIRAFGAFLAQTQDTQKVRAVERSLLNQRINAETLDRLTQLTTDRTEEAFSREGSPHVVVMRALVSDFGYAVEPAIAGEENELLSIVEQSGLRVRRVLLRPGWWRRDSGLLIGYRGEKRTPVGLLPAASGQYQIFDPESDHYRPVDKHVADELDIVAFLIYRSFSGTVRTFWRAVRFGLTNHRKDITVAAVAALSAALLDAIVPAATGLFVDYVIPYSDRLLLWQLGALMGIAAAGSFCLQFVQASAITRAQSGFTHVCQAAFWDKLLRLSPGFFRTAPVGQFLQQALTVLLIDVRLQTWNAQTFTAVVSVAVLLAAMAMFSLPLALIHAAAGVFLLAAGVVCALRIYALARVSEQLAGELAGATVQVIGGIAKIRAGGAEARALAVWSRAFSKQQRRERKTQRLEDSLRVLQSCVPVLTVAATLWYAAEVQQVGQPGSTIGLGALVAVLAASGAWFRALGEMTLRAPDVALIANQWRFGRDILLAPQESGTRKMHPGALTGRITVQEVSFRYKDDGPLTLDKVCLDLEPGSSVAIVGPSGSGKSSLVNLLLGFESPASGAILYDGLDLAGLDLRLVRSQVGVVMQETRLMSGSIWEQITVGSGATLEQAWEAARAAGLADEIQRMPMGMHTVVSEGGTNISGGQRQRLLIARALVLKPRVLIFDEATSALDNRTQAIVTETLRKLSMTRILIAHRLSTIRDADRIYVLKRGQVVEQGTYDELVARNATFANLVRRQRL